MWKAVEIKVGESRMAKAERKRGKRGSRKKARGKRKGKKTEEGENNRCEESSREVGNLGWKRGGGKIGRRSKEVGTRETL